MRDDCNLRCFFPIRYVNNHSTGNLKFHSSRLKAFKLSFILKIHTTKLSTIQMALVWQRRCGRKRRRKNMSTRHRKYQPIACVAWESHKTFSTIWTMRRKIFLRVVIGACGHSISILHIGKIFFLIRWRATTLDEIERMERRNSQQFFKHICWYWQMLLTSYYSETRQDIQQRKNMSTIYKMRIAVWSLAIGVSCTMKY